ncbi:MAG: CCA tRNA nucleotidyltransferase [Chlamydiales bacterium]|nr:CCA tRNA nucleotidyltransferase [Chlamydiales bacterium]
MTTLPLLLATSICQTLFEAGYTAYFAGGWVRDLLLDNPTDEIDIATSAPPHVIQELFPKTIPVGIAFGVVIVVLEGINFEVTTFRKDHPYYDGRHPEGVDFSTPEKDAFRRDFTINGMFFDPLSESIYDYVGGREDLEKRLIRAIGDPRRRFSEDRLRMIRAVRFSARLEFRIEEETDAAICELASTLFPSVSMERIWQEFCKMAAFPHFDQALIQLKRLNLLETIFPQLKEADIEKLVSPFLYFPLRSPAIIYLLELFPDASLEERIALCSYLKTSNAEKKLVEFFTRSSALFDQPGTEPYDWAHLYAHPHSELLIRVRAARIYPPERIVFLEEHEARRERLKKHIERIQEHRPLVTSAMLKEKGIPPGKKMGQLLKEAERFAVNHHLDSPEEVLKMLPINE